MTTRFLDLRSEQSDPFPSRTIIVEGKSVKENRCKIGPDHKVVKRDITQITGICFHQTACVFGAPDNKPDSRYRRALNIPAHGVGFLDGVAVLPAPISWYLYHGNGLNADTLGLELEGHFSGLLDDHTTVPRREDIESSWNHKEPTPLTEVAVQCYRDLTKRVVEEARAMGAPIEFAWAHRQSNGTKEADPGQGIWQLVVLDYAVRVLGLKTQPLGFRRDVGKDRRRDGKPIPSQWEPGVAGLKPY